MGREEGGLGGFFVNRSSLGFFFPSEDGIYILFFGHFFCGIDYHSFFFLTFWRGGLVSMC